MDFWDYLKPEKDLYALLGVKKDCSFEDIERAFKKGQKFPQLKEAFNILNNPVERALFDLLHLVPASPEEALKSLPPKPDYLGPSSWYHALKPDKRRR